MITADELIQDYEEDDSGDKNLLDLVCNANIEYNANNMTLVQRDKVFDWVVDRM